ncbi:hypothetical protein [Actinoplanes sp. L3-i22]|uniref:hypothetical protein n=1 Tax=Actinoplanes sp. L3-i22 TaxID=2836373 RepID=UPI001C747A02|nr:hypothetical protein [Actinoplanes sp. L3-i22]BCY11837.1 hypothetical protein L3i22_069250 [Actinoplanes sp. L3-i22]
MPDVAECVSRSCTTGWLDWIHGELWLTPWALVRRRLTLAETMSNGYGPTVRLPLPQLDAAWLNPGTILSEHHTNKFILYDSIAAAQLVKGTVSGALRITLHDGTRHKLLWLNNDPAHAVLFAHLPAVLGSRVRLS